MKRRKEKLAIFLSFLLYIILKHVIKLNFTV